MESWKERCFGNSFLPTSFFERSQNINSQLYLSLKTTLVHSLYYNQITCLSGSQTNSSSFIALTRAWTRCNQQVLVTPLNSCQVCRIIILSVATRAMINEAIRPSTSLPTRAKGSTIHLTTLNSTNRSIKLKLNIWANPWTIRIVIQVIILILFNSRTITQPVNRLISQSRKHPLRFLNQWTMALVWSTQTINIRLSTKQSISWWINQWFNLMQWTNQLSLADRVISRPIMLCACWNSHLLRTLSRPRTRCDQWHDPQDVPMLRSVAGSATSVTKPRRPRSTTNLSNNQTSRTKEVYHNNQSIKQPRDRLNCHRLMIWWTWSNQDLRQLHRLHQVGLQRSVPTCLVWTTSPISRSLASWWANQWISQRINRSRVNIRCNMTPLVWQNGSQLFTPTWTLITWTRCELSSVDWLVDVLLYWLIVWSVLYCHHCKWLSDCICTSLCCWIIIFDELSVYK